MKRCVAMKIIKLGMDTKEVIARFEQERQALALMDHPNIAKVFDAGATQSGRPFFVMELIKGVPITTYCDQENHSTDARLELFIQVCGAVQHAHQKGIIHRDLKPSNILVTVQNGVPATKVIDFGIAKATQGRLTDKSLHTELAQLIGTPPYMSPEQAEMTALDIDTRSDIYSLGVVLYELLVGRTPFDPETLMKAGIDEIRRVIREKEPPKPSTALQTMPDKDRKTAAVHRRTEVPKLVTMIRGDLDWIVMKALEKDRTRRYETANGFAEDVRRYLGNEPVTAAAPSAAYKFRKFARRNRTALAAAITIGIVLIMATGFSFWQVVRAKDAERKQSELREQAERLNVQLLRTRADVYGRRGEWKNAADDLREVLKRDPSDHWDWLRFAALLVKNGDHAEYARVRREMLVLFRDTDQATIADRIAKGALLLQGEAEVVAAARALAARALRLGSDHGFLPYYQLTASLAAYRSGDVSEARRLAELVLEAKGGLDTNIHALASLQLAMVLHRLAELEEAQEAMAEARQSLERFVKTTTGELEQNYWQNWWHDWLILQIIRAEAEAAFR